MPQRTKAKGTKRPIRRALQHSAPEMQVRDPVGRERSASFSAASAALQEGIARICHLYGLAPLIGRLYAILFLSTQPRSLEDLTTEACAAKSSVSVALRKLLSARVVRRLPPRGDRRDFYEAVSDPWAVFADWSRLFFQPELDMWSETSRALSNALDNASDAPKPSSKAEELKRRIAALQGFTEVIEGFIGSVSRSRQAPAPARTIPIVIEGDGR